MEQLSAAEDVFPKGKAAAITALQLDPDLARSPHLYGGPAVASRLAMGRGSDRIQAQSRTRSYLPNCEPLVRRICDDHGTAHEAIARMKNRPGTRSVVAHYQRRSRLGLYFARRYDEAIEQLRRAVELDPNYPVTYWILGLLLRKTGRYELAITEGEKGVNLSGGSPLMRAALAHTYGTAGRTKEALADPR